MNSESLNHIDEFLYSFLMNHSKDMPRRFGKMIAMYYGDARVRKAYSHYIGVEMGEGTFANLGMTIVPNDHPICVHIGKNVSIAPNVTFLGGTEPNNGVEIKKYKRIASKNSYYLDIDVGDEAWLGAGVIIFPGIKIGKCAVIGAGSVVMQDVPDYTIVVGTPAKKIGMVTDDPE